MICFCSLPITWEKHLEFPLGFTELMRIRWTFLKLSQTRNVFEKFRTFFSQGKNFPEYRLRWTTPSTNDMFDIHNFKDSRTQHAWSKTSSRAFQLAKLLFFVCTLGVDHHCTAQYQTCPGSLASDCPLRWVKTPSPIFGKRFGHI